MVYDRRAVILKATLPEIRDERKRPEKRIAVTADPLVLIVDLLLAGVLGGAVGVQRQAAQKPAGFRTHLLVALGTCAFVEMGRLLGDTRIAAGVLTGVGFIGAGTIFRSGMTAHGLTTAASIWVVAAIGMAMGFGHPYSLLIATTVTIITLGVLSISDELFAHIFRRKAVLNIVCTAFTTLADIVAVFAKGNVRYTNADRIAVRRTQGGLEITMSYYLDLPRNAVLDELVAGLCDLSGVQTVTVNEALSST